MIDERLGANKMRAQGRPDGPCLTPSFIRTMTVGSGVSPDLLTPGMAGALAGSSFDLPPVGTFTPP
jgi:hypothetical protein